MRDGVRDWSGGKAVNEGQSLIANDKYTELRLTAKEQVVSTSRGRQDDVLGYRWHEPPPCYSH